MRFLVITTGRNCVDRVTACLESIAGQDTAAGGTGRHDLHLVVVDDCSDDGTGDLVERFLCDHPTLPATFRRTVERRGAMANQWDSWHVDGVEWDAAIWCDLDDRLNGPNVLDRVAQEYEAGALVTYGSYRSEPFSSTCAPAERFPPEVIAGRAYRAFMRAGGGIRINHLRTVSRGVLDRISEEDCRDDRGEWWSAAPDYAVTVPALELAGPAHSLISDVLYVYTSDRADAEWRVRSKDVNRVHQTIMGRAPKVDVSPRAAALARRAAIEARRNRRVRV